jgi:FKBP-type peptidyl-prolyl cis-trans isomerase
MKKIIVFVLVLFILPLMTACSKTDTPKTFEPVEKLVIETLEKGKGKVVVEGSNIAAHYTGMFTDGEVFDTSDGRDPIHFTAGGGQVIKGWDQGFIGMKEGEKRRLSIPPTLGYGLDDFGPIPGGSTLIFEVELMEIKN